MPRVVIVAIVSIVIGAGSALAQVFNPNINPIPSLPPPPTPPIATPHLEAVPPVIGSDSATRPVRVPQLGPGTPARPSFSDRATNCMHQGTAIGVPPGAIGEYTRECANSQ